MLRRNSDLFHEKGLLIMKWFIGVSILATALGWAGTMTIPAATVAPDEATLKYFPPETQSIAFVDVAALRNAPLVQDALKSGQFQTPQNFQEIIDKTGFDIRRDLDTVTVGSINTRERLIVANAHYDKLKVEQFLRDSGNSFETYLGRDIYRVGDGEVALVDNIVLFGTGNALKSAIDRITYPGPSQIGSDLLDAIKTIEAGNQIWAVSNAPQQTMLPPGINESTPAVKILKTVRGGKYQMRIDRDVHARATANFVDAESARNLADMARGFIAVTKLQIAKQQPDFLPVLDGIQVSNSGSSVVAQIDESGDLLMKLQNVRGQALLKH
jgi:hypothetical protein